MCCNYRISMLQESVPNFNKYPAILYLSSVEIPENRKSMLFISILHCVFCQAKACFSGEQKQKEPAKLIKQDIYQSLLEFSITGVGGWGRGNCKNHEK